MTTTDLWPVAQWRGPIPTSNYSTAGIGLVVGLVVHHGDGSLASIDGEFHRPGSEKSAHYGADFDGAAVAWVLPSMVAYAGCLANWTGYLSVELANDPNAPDAPATEAQVATVAGIARHHGIAAQQVVFMGGPGVGFHRQWPGACEHAWGQTSCPGDGIAHVSVPAIVAAMTGAPPSPTEGEQMLFKTITANVETYYRDASGILVALAPEEAAVYYPAVQSGQIPVVTLATGPQAFLAVLRYNANTVAALHAAGLQ